MDENSNTPSSGQQPPVSAPNDPTPGTRAPAPWKADGSASAEQPAASGGGRGPRKPLKIAALALAAVLVVALGLTAVFMVNRKPAAQPDSIPPTRSDIQGTMQGGGGGAIGDIKPPQRDKDVDFAELRTLNEDIIGWIELPGTVIDYPVVNGIDNVYYLTHNEYKQDYAGGALFTDMANAPDFMDPVTVVYGHYMPDESLFTQLHRYEDEAYFDQNRTLRVYTPIFQFNYEIVGAFYHGQDNLLYEKDYRTPEDKAAFLDWLGRDREGPCYTDLSKVTASDSFIVLSTCAALDDSSTRYVVVARLVNMS